MAMAAQMGNLEKAGRLIKITVWIISGFCAMIMGLLMIFDPFGFIFNMFLLLVIGGFLILYLFVASAIQKNATWAKVIGVLISINWLLTIPFGTVAGAFTLYYLIRGWNERVMPPNTPKGGNRDEREVTAVDPTQLSIDHLKTEVQ